MQPFSPEEEQQMMAQIYYLIKDPIVQKMLLDDPNMKALLPALSHLIRTSNLDKNTVTLLKLRWKVACRLQLLIKQKPDLVSLAKFQAWVMFGYAALEDTINGWRGRIVTERQRIYKVESGNRQRKKFLGIL
jgi:hypothetical protein